MEENKEQDSKKITITLPKMAVPKINPWVISTVVLLLISIVLFIRPQMFGITGGAGIIDVGGTGETLTAEQAGQKAVDYINNNLVQGTDKANLVSAEEFTTDLYKAETQYQGNDIRVYISKNGRWLFVSDPFDTTETVTTTQPQQQPPSPTVTKSDKPEAHAFVMSHCPFGLQFMKAYIPVMELLGDKADLELNFVNYAMHGEKEVYEQLRMHCINTEQTEKFTDYLRCFVEDGDHERCLDEVGIDTDALQSCMDATDDEYNIAETLQAGEEAWGSRFPPFPIDDALNQQYAVRGSPTFVLNGQVISVNRAADSIKQAVCEAFNTPPEECDQTLKTSGEGSGFGSIGSVETSGDAGAACG